MSDKSYIISVSQLGFYLKSIVDGDNKLSDIFISGEISNLKHQYSSGHIYFTLKDDRSSIPAVIFKSYVSNIPFDLKEGSRVICQASVSIYDKDTKLQLYVKRIQPFGYGSLYLAFEQLKSKLEKLGYFSEEAKKKLPNFPKNVAVLTSETGSVIHDITNIVSRRFPLCDLYIVNIPVQGEGAEHIIAEKLLKCDRTNNFDVIIIARGGGSFEDLAPFNTEILANAIFNCNTPIVSAVGHETDFTICDFVSDLRAPTPSAAAELVFRDVNELSLYFKNARSKINNSYIAVIKNKQHELDLLRKSRYLSDPKVLIDDKIAAFLQTKKQFYNKCNKFVENRKKILEGSIVRLNDLSPLSVLLRGYTITSKDSSTVKSINEIFDGDLIKLRFTDGTANCQVLNTEKV